MACQGHRDHPTGEPKAAATQATVLNPCWHPVCALLPAETAARSTITQICEGTNQIQRMVMARQLLK
jgi:alkylation response protein AidB-like acyl-CoA dehydrogenase